MKYEDVILKSVFVFSFLSSLVLLSMIVLIVIDPQEVNGIFFYGNHYDYVMSHENTEFWSIGNNLNDGDFYHYEICNDDSMSQKIYPYHCYEITLEFIKVLQSFKGYSWIVQGHITFGNNTNSMILLVDPYTFEVTTDPLNVDVGNSLEKTIFSLSKYGKKSLSIGSVWDNIDSYFTNKIPIEIKSDSLYHVSNMTVTTQVLSYDVIVPSETLINFNFPFPLYSDNYSPHIIFPEPKQEYYYELLDFVRYPIYNNIENFSIDIDFVGFD